MGEQKESGPSTAPITVNEAHEQPGITTEAPPPMSKKALKKAAKAERWQAAKLERRAREKQAKKEKKKIIAQKRAAGELDEDVEDQKRSAKRRKVKFGGHVVVDLGFDDLMNEKEIKSLCSQLAYTYSANRGADYPFSLLFTSLDGNTVKRLESLGDASYKRWSNSEWWSDGYERLWETPLLPGSLPEKPSESSATSSEQPPSDPAAEALLGGVQVDADDIRQKIVYLTADCEEELSELKPDETYIIGGICDHNRYKNLCFNKAKGHGVRTAKLPIGRYLSNLPTRKVLTVNQVFEILLKWVETKDWEEALYSVIPKRKFQTGDNGNDSKVLAEAVPTGEGEKDGDEDGIGDKEEEDVKASKPLEGGTANEPSMSGEIAGDNA